MLHQAGRRAARPSEETGVIECVRHFSQPATCVCATSYLSRSLSFSLSLSLVRLPTCSRDGELFTRDTILRYTTPAEPSSVRLAVCIGIMARGSFEGVLAVWRTRSGDSGERAGGGGRGDGGRGGGAD